MRIEFHAREDVLEDDGPGDPSAYLVHVRAELIDEHEDDEQVVGRASGCVFRHECALEDGADLFDVGDSFDQDKHSASCAMMDYDAQCLREDLSSDGVGFRTSNLLFVERMQIAASHRGRGCGLLLMQRLIRRFGTDCSAVVIEPHPINHLAKDESDKDWRARMQWKSLASTKAVGVRKLQKHWRQLGFKPVPGSKTHFYLDLDSGDLPDDVRIAS